MRDNQFGSLVVARNYATMEQVYECLAIQQQYQAVGGPVPKLGEIMAMKGYMSPQQVQEILASFQGSKAGLFGDIAIRMRLATKEQVDYCLAVQRDSDARTLPHKRIGEIMVQYNYLRPYQVEQILGSQNAKSQRCYSCGNEFSVGPFRPGTQLQCPNCRAINIVGSAQPPAAFQPPAPVQIPVATQQWQNQMAQNPAVAQPSPGGGLMGQVSFAGAGRMPAGSGINPAPPKQMFPSPAGGVQQPMVGLNAPQRPSESVQAYQAYAGGQGGTVSAPSPMIPNTPRMGTGSQSPVPHAATISDPSRGSQAANASRSGMHAGVGASVAGRASGATARASGSRVPSIMRPSISRPTMGRSSGSAAVPIAPQPAVRKPVPGLGIDEADQEITSVADLGTFNLSNYQMLEKLDSDGMGARFKGRHSRTGDLVEIFVLDPSFTLNAPFLAQWLAQGRRAMMLEHPNLAKLLYAGNDGKNHYAIQEYIEGKSVKRMLYDLGPFQPKEALDVMWQVCQGLRYAHDQGIFHGFLSPSSILIGFDGRSRVTSLGLLVDGVKAVASQVAAQGQIDIPIYLTPELTIEGQRADQRSDIYSLGATFFHMLTGQPPLVGDSATTVLMKAAENEIPTLSSVRPDLPGFLDEIITKMMAVEATERYQSMMQMASDLLRARQAVDRGAEKLEGGAVGTAAIGDRDGVARLESGKLTARGRTGGKKKKKKKGQTQEAKAVATATAGAAPNAEGRSILDALEMEQQDELNKEIAAGATTKKKKKRKHGVATREEEPAGSWAAAFAKFVMFVVLVSLLVFILIRIDMKFNNSRYWDKMRSMWTEWTSGEEAHVTTPPPPTTGPKGVNPTPPTGPVTPPVVPPVTPPVTHPTPPPVLPQTDVAAFDGLRAEADPAKKIVLADAFVAKFPDSDKKDQVIGQRQLALEALSTQSFKDLVKAGFEADDLVAAHKFNDARAQLKTWAGTAGDGEDVKMRVDLFTRKLDKTEAEAFAAITKQVNELVDKTEFDAAKNLLDPVQNNFDPAKYLPERNNLLNHVQNAKAAFDDKEAALKRAELEAAAKVKREAEAVAVYNRLSGDLQSAAQELDFDTAIKLLQEAKPKLWETTSQAKFEEKVGDMKVLLGLRKRLLTAIAEKKLAADTITYQQQDVQVVKADEKTITLKMPEGDTEMKWKAIPPLAICDLIFNCIDETNPEDWFQVGIWREYMGNLVAAKIAYSEAVKLGHEKAKGRLERLTPK
ncbi:MAG TPA: protein kinase [Planctomycetota bacterium]|nr:protein kinase [Planctomycetota bacterium]